MFQKIISNLSFSPQAGSQLSFYLKRLRQENFTRRLSAIAAIVAFSFQMAAIVAPPTPTIAASTNDIVWGGLDEKNPKEDMLRIYDQDKSCIPDGKCYNGYQKLFSYFGISRQNIKDSTLGSINAGDSNDQEFWRSLGRNPHSNLDKQVQVENQTYYLRPLWTWGANSSYPALLGKRADGTPFAIMVDCGNIAIKDTIKVAEPTIKCIDLKSNRTKGEVPLTVTLTARAEATNQKITKYHFTFGDGNKKTSSDRQVEHKYKEPGKYTAFVRVEGSTGRITERSNACSVDMEAKPKPVVKRDLDCVELTGTPVNGPAPLKVKFTGSGTAENQKISQYIFNFGDGKQETKDTGTATHTYSTVGTYTATMSVKGSKTNKIATSENCEVTMTVEPAGALTSPDIELSKTATNLSKLGTDGQPSDAHNAVAGATQMIQYTLYTKNTGSGTAKDYVVTENVRDILEYADVVDTGGGILNDGILTWPEQDIAAGATVLTSFRTIIKNPIPTTPTSTSDPQSFDLKMDNVYGNLVQVNLETPTTKQVEAAATALPQTGPETAFIIMLLVATMIVYFYFRNQQLVQEVQILRNDHRGHQEK